MVAPGTLLTGLCVSAVARAASTTLTAVEVYMVSGPVVDCPLPILKIDFWPANFVEYYPCKCPLSVSARVYPSRRKFETASIYQPRPRDLEEFSFTRASCHYIISLSRPGPGHRRNPTTKGGMRANGAAESVALQPFLASLFEVLGW